MEHEMKIKYKGIILIILKLYNKIFKTNFIAITIINTIYSFVEVKEETELYSHEYVHYCQIKYFGVIKFYFKYLIFSIQKGYWDNPFEKDARALQNMSAPLIEEYIKVNYPLFYPKR